MLVATAGHVDHGKTALVRAITGVETDRLPEERRRGISIDLGFAYWHQPDGGVIGFVDVPGHERYLRNMLAGLSGIGFALLVVAADDGVMPQTAEHVQCLRLLGIDRMIVAISKTDRVDPARIAQTRDEVETLLAGSRLANAAVLPVSASTGAGIEALKAALLSEREAMPPASAEGRNFRLAIDRTFSLVGAGTIVTGTVLAGEVRSGDRLMLTPAGLPVRLRGLQRAGEDVGCVRAGERCALNLAGVELHEVGRGDWLVAPAMHAPTRRIEVQVEALAERTEPLRHNAHVHVHLHAAAIPGRLLTPRQVAIPPGEAAMAHLVLDRPASGVTGERFVLRDPSGRQLIGGGMVVDPLLPAGRLRLAERTGIAQALSHADPAASLQALLELPGQEVDCDAFARRFNLTPPALAALLARPDIVLLGKAPPLALPRDRVERIGAQMIGALDAFHAANPTLGGMSVQKLRGALGAPISPAACLAIVRSLAEAGTLAFAGGLLRRPGHSAGYSEAEMAQWHGLLDWLDGQGIAPFELEDAARDLAVREISLRAMLMRRCANGELLILDERRFLLRSHAVVLAGIAMRLSQEAGPQGFGAARFRDESGMGRNMAIRLLEYFDRTGITRRRGDLRTMARDHQLVLGTG